MAAGNNITIKFKSQGAKSLRTALKNLAKAQEQLAGASKKVEVATGKTEKANNKLLKNNRLLGNSFATLRSHMLLYSFAMSMGIKQMIEMTKHSTKVDAMRLSFDSLTQSAGIASGTLEKLRKATNNTASDADLLTQANNALILGVATSSDQMARMFDVAQRLGRALGRDAASSVESLITGIGRQSRLMLDNIGIIVKADEAYKSYAEKLGITADKLTDAQKKTAFLNATMEAAEKKVQALGEEQLGAVDNFSAFSASLSNAADVIGKRLTPTLSLAARVYGGFIDDIIGANPEVKKYGGIIKDLENNQAELTSKVEMAREAIDKQSTTSKDYFDNLIRLNPTIKNAGDAEEYLTAQIKLQEKQIKILINMIEKQKVAYDSFIEPVQDVTGALWGLDEILSRIGTVPKIDLSGITLGDTGGSEISFFENMFGGSAEVIEEITAQGIFVAQTLSNSFSGLSDSMSNSMNVRLSNELKTLKDSEKYQKASYKKKKEMEKDLNDSYAKERTRVAQFEKVSNIANAGINIATSLTNPKVLTNPVLFSIVAALGAAQMATIIGTPIPKYATGGMVGGRRHSQGGTMIEAEQGEFVMSRNAVNAVGVEAMNRINAGGGAGSVVVNVSGNVMSQDYVEGELADQLKEAIRRGADIGVS
jgi:hypothetical protein